MTLDCFLDRFADPAYCDPTERPKTVKAFKALCEQLKDETINEWPRILVFAPSPWCYGNCLNLVPRDENDDALIYLAPCLEKHTQAQVNSTVAEEFAHAMLRHHKEMTLTPDEAKTGYPNFPSEQAAKKKVVEWGFELRTSRPKSPDLAKLKGKTNPL